MVLIEVVLVLLVVSASVTMSGLPVLDGCAADVVGSQAWP